MKKIYYVYSILACLFTAMLFGCTTDELEKGQPVDFSKLKVVVNATMPAYEGEEEVTTKLTDSGTWQSGDNIYMCVGSEKNSFKLTYRGGGEWGFSEWEGGNWIEAFSEPTGKLTALYCQFGELKRVNGKITGKTTGDIVYTKEGKYRVLDNIIYFDINLNIRPVAKMVIKDVGPKMHPSGKITGFSYLDGLWDIKWNNQGTTGRTYMPDYPHRGEMTIWGEFPSGPEIVLIEIKGKDKVETYKRQFNSSATLNPGEMVTIYGPLGKDADKWTHYDVDGNEIKRAVVKYTSDYNSYNVLPPKFKLERIDGISVIIFGEDGEEIKFSGSDRATFTVDNSDILFPATTLGKNGIILGGSSKGTTFLNIKLPSYYELENSRYEFEVTDANFANRLQLYIAKQIDGEYKPIGYYYNDVKRGEVRYLKIKYEGDDWMNIAFKRPSGTIDYYFDVEKKYDDVIEAIEIEPILPQVTGTSNVYKITVKNKSSTHAAMAEITFKRKSNPAQIGDFFIQAVK